jgi:hypothetical protein
MASGAFDSILFKHLWGTAALRAVFNDENRVQKWFDFEAALALAQAELGIIPQAAAEEIARKAKVENVDLEAIGAGIRKINHPLVPALRELQAACADGYANISISGRPPRTCSTPERCFSSEKRTASSCAISARSGARSMHSPKSTKTRRW